MKKEILTNDELYDRLEMLSDLDALEIYPVMRKNAQDLIIPFLMNDSVECCILLSGIHTDGQLQKSEHNILLSEELDEPAFLISQDGGTPVEVGFSEAFLTTVCYQYHRICHFWQDDHIRERRICYILGTLYDKCHYLPEKYHTEKELWLTSLLDFVPLRYFGPMGHTPEEVPEGTAEAASRLLEALAGSAPESLRILLTRYRTDAATGRLTLEKVRKYADALQKEGALYSFLETEIARESMRWNVRTYTEITEKKLSDMRSFRDREARDEGFSGSYPEYMKNDIRRIYYEEHAYVVDVCEYDDFTCRVSGFIDTDMQGNILKEVSFYA